MGNDAHELASGSCNTVRKEKLAPEAVYLRVGAEPTSGARACVSARSVTQSGLVRGQPREGDAVTTRLMATPGRRGSHDSPEANPGRVMTACTPAGVGLGRGVTVSPPTVGLERVVTGLGRECASRPH
jgi:hypothetical protein